MPVTPTYPGVYVEEIPSGVRTITGVATSITAFIGRAKWGPTDTAIRINSFADFERIFGGLWLDSNLGFAVRDFYLNGGSAAIIVRLYRPPAEPAEGEPPAPDASAQLTIGAITLEAASPGKWGANLRATIDQNGITQDLADAMGVPLGNLFNLTVRDTGPSGATEKFVNLSTQPGPRRIDKVLAAESTLVQWAGDYPSDPTAAPAVAPGDDAVTAAEKEWLDAKKAYETLLNSGTATEEELNAARTERDEAKTAFDEARQEFEDSVSDGRPLIIANFLPVNGEVNKEGLHALEQADLFNLLCIPPYTSTGDVDVPLVSAAAAYCEKRRAMLLVDPRSNWNSKTIAVNQFTDINNDNVGTRSRNAVLYFPRIMQPNPLRENQIEEFVPSGAVAGVMARTDTQRGVWKAPAGLDANLVGVPQLELVLTDDENGELNPLGVNCLRAFPVAGRVVWGARTLRGADQLADEYKYVPVRRLALFIEESLYRGLQWVVFEPNDEPLWAQIRLNAGAFMHNLFRQGAFQGASPREAYFVKCDKETTTQNDINLGIVNILVGFAPLKPAEFVIIKLQQMAGQVEA
jgi:uncharacterized protein